MKKSELVEIIREEVTKILEAKGKKFNPTSDGTKDTAKLGGGSPKFSVEDRKVAGKALAKSYKQVFGSDAAKFVAAVNDYEISRPLTKKLKDWLKKTYNKNASQMDVDHITSHFKDAKK